MQAIFMYFSVSQYKVIVFNYKFLNILIINIITKK